MSDQWSHDERDWSELLRQEARAALPPFSEPLHERICLAVRQFKADETAAAWRVGPERMRLGWAPLACAACLLAAIVALRAGGRTATPPPSPPPVVVAESIAQSPGLPSLPGFVDRTAIEAGKLIDDQLVTTQLAYLEHDARRLANMVTGGTLASLVRPSAIVTEPDR